jgi:hypothetical protein
MRSVLSTIALLATACTMPVAAPPAPLVAFNPAEVTWAQGSGTATIEGQAFMKTRGGDVKYGAGNQVVLLPYSAQSFNWYTQRLATRGEDVSPMDPALTALTRTTTAGGDGRFKFENLPAGSYLVVTSVTWEAPTSYGMSMQGGYIGAPATAEAGKTTSVIITG